MKASSSKMRFLGLIPARGGFRDPVTLAGRPLISCTSTESLNSSRLDRIVFSADDPEITDLVKDLGAEVPFIRPAHLATHRSPMLGVLVHALEWLKLNEDYRPEAIVLLHPTTPLRTASHVDRAIKHLNREMLIAGLVSLIPRSNPSRWFISRARKRNWPSGEV